jgi:hypothetical protein
VFSMLEMMRCGLLSNQVLPLSVWLDDSIDEYRAQIRNVVDTGLIHRWVNFFAVAVRDQALAQLRLISRLEALAERFARELPGTGVIARVLTDLIGFPVVNHRAIEDRYHVSMKYATDVTRRLVKAGVLVNWESRRYNQIFFCVPVLDLLGLNSETTANDRRSDSQPTFAPPLGRLPTTERHEHDHR